MQADFIQEILYKLDDMPYKCILIDGVWGIGKSYAIDKALEALQTRGVVCRNT